MKPAAGGGGMDNDATMDRVNNRDKSSQTHCGSLTGGVLCSSLPLQQRRLWRRARFRPLDGLRSWTCGTSTRARAQTCLQYSGHALKRRDSLSELAEKKDGVLPSSSGHVLAANVHVSGLESAMSCLMPMMSTASVTPRTRRSALKSTAPLTLAALR